MRSIASIKDKQFLIILNEVKKEVLKLFGDKLIQLILYGSYARNTQDPESDIDFMILVDENETKLRDYRGQIVDIMTDLSLKYNTVISFTRESYGRYIRYLEVLPFFHNINHEGVEIYGKNTG
ncbi:MAG TPA: nucleotidyltransferase domain-containing protein [Candidatus Deferrimicrobium sp.]|nr:nucleotidyltransferase domain-containing protein [Candidatus Deferrimicrobium sp.]